MHSREHNYYVYIMTNRSKTLYTGMTNNLLRRVWEHKQAAGSGFCAQYKLDLLVYFERFRYVGNAITREKQIKGWLRIKKIALIVEKNPAWHDLSADWYSDCRPQRSAQVLRCAQDDKKGGVGGGVVAMSPQSKSSRVAPRISL